MATFLFLAYQMREVTLLEPGAVVARTHSFFLATFGRLIREEDGATAVEYGLMIAAIAAAIITTVISVGSEVDGAFTFVNTEIAGLTP